MRRLVGLIPAAGAGSRLGLTGSKELAPVAAGATDSPRSGSTRHRPVVTSLLDAMGTASIEAAFVVLRHGKWDIPERLADGLDRSPALAYVVTRATSSIPETLDRARPHLGADDVLLGFPDVVFHPAGAASRLVAVHRNSDCDIALALFPSDRPDKTDMVEVEGDRVTGFRIKPGPCELEYTWILATWKERFTEFLRAYLERTRGRAPAGSSLSELQISQVLAAALTEGLTISGCCFPEGRFIDVGTPEDLARAQEGAI